jgi:hypothetical protein
VFAVTIDVNRPIVLMLLVLCAAPSAPGTDPLVRHVAEVAAPDIARPVAFTLDQHYEIRIGSIYRQQQTATFALAGADGATVAARALAISTDGRDASASARSKAEHDLLAAPPFHQPFDERYLGEYAYDVQGLRVNFRALVRDAVHGDGRFDVDPDGHVTAMQYAPCAVEAPANDGTVRLERAELASGYWGLSRLHAEYRGRKLFVSGTLVLDGSVSAVRVHGSLDDALADMRSR